MKKRILFIILLSVFIISGCHRTSKTPERWASLGTEFDSINRELERHWYLDYGHDTIRRLTTQLDSMAMTPKQKLRVLYWKLNDEDYRENNTISEDELRTLETGADSVTERYDWYRYKNLAYFASRSSYSDYLKFLDESQDYYKSIDDTLQVAFSIHTKAFLYFYISDFDNSIKGMNEAIELYNSHNPEYGKTVKTMINLAIIENQKGNKEEAMKILEKLLQNKNLLRDIHLAARLFNIIYKMTGDPSYLYKALKIDTIGVKIPSSLGFYYLKTDQDSLEKYARMSLERSRKTSKLEWKALSYNLMFEHFLNTGQTDSALYYSLLYKDEYQKFQDMKDRDNFTNMQLKKELSEREMERTRRTNRLIITIILSTSVIALLAVGIYLGWKIRMKNLKLQNANQRIELERLQRQEAFRAITTQQTKKNSDRILDEIGGLAETKEISSRAADTIKRAVKANSQPDIEWDELCRSIEKIHPEFQRYLRTLYPDITETMMRTALYTRMGISGKRLASVLGIEYNSVKKRRYLLRTMLGLKAGEKLEARLAELEEEAKRKFIKSIK